MLFWNETLQKLREYKRSSLHSVTIQEKESCINGVTEWKIPRQPVNLERHILGLKRTTGYVHIRTSDNFNEWVLISRLIPGGATGNDFPSGWLSWITALWIMKQYIQKKESFQGEICCSVWELMIHRVNSMWSSTVGGQWSHCFTNLVSQTKSRN